MLCVLKKELVLIVCPMLNFGNVYCISIHRTFSRSELATHNINQGYIRVVVASNKTQ